MSRRVAIRKAGPAEIDWINATYDEVDFKHSVYDNEYIAIAESAGARIGLGRLVHIEDGVAELGGIYVSEPYRGLGAAREIVGHLLNNAGDYRKIYCIPFSHLEFFYRRFGFEAPRDMLAVPGPVGDKYHWCGSNYEKQTLLLVRNRAPENAPVAPELHGGGRG